MALRPLSGHVMYARVISQQVIDIGEEVEHTVVRQHALRVKGGYVIAVHLTQEGQRTAVQHRVLHILRHVGVSPELAFAEKVAPLFH